MNNKTRMTRTGMIGMIVFIGVLALHLTGCHSLRKKFTRKKKDTKRDEIIPVLDPIDYTALAPTPIERYSQFYNMWKVWQTDLIRALNDQDTEKRQRYLLTQIVLQLEKMSVLLDEAKRSEMLKVRQGYQNLEKAFRKPDSVKNYYILIRQVERLGRVLRSDLDVPAVQKHFVTLQE